MSTRILVILIALVLVGCGPMPPKPPLDVVKNCGDRLCRVPINPAINGDGSCTISAPDLQLMGGQPTRIVWDLPNPGDYEYQFCASAGDGAFLKNVNQDQFSNGAATDNDDASNDTGNPARCKKHYRIDDANTDHATYQYSLQFHYFKNHNSLGTCKYDPQIRNG